MEQDLLTRLQLAFNNICHIRDGKLRLELKRMYNTCQTLVTELSKEAVQCRRLGKTTVKFNSINAELELAVTNLEHYTIYATLLDVA